MVVKVTGFELLKMDLQDVEKFVTIW